TAVHTCAHPISSFSPNTISATSTAAQIPDGISGQNGSSEPDTTDVTTQIATMTTVAPAQSRHSLPAHAGKALPSSFFTGADRLADSSTTAFDDSGRSAVNFASSPRVIAEYAACSRSSYSVSVRRPSSKAIRNLPATASLSASPARNESWSGCITLPP